MKKLYTILGILMVSGFIFAQNSMQVYNVGKTNVNSSKNVLFNKTITPVIANKSINAGNTHRVYQYWRLMSALAGNTSPIVFFNNLFPDSVIRVLYSDENNKLSLGAPWIHALGNIFDPFDPFRKGFNDPTNYPGELNLTPQSTYKIDTISVQCLYYRKLSSNIVDTLVLEVIPEDAAKWNVTYWANNSITTNLGVDTVDVALLPYDSNVTKYTSKRNLIKMAGVQTFKVLLTDSILKDTFSDGSLLIHFVTKSLPLYSGYRLIGTSLKFIPGYNYDGTDTLSAKNRFLFVSSREIKNGYMFNYVKHTYNSSSLLDIFVRYKNGKSWNGSFIPSVVYEGGTKPTFNYEHHIINYAITCTKNCGWVGLDENVDGKDLVLGNVYPNPAIAGSTITIPFNVSNNNANITINVYNNIGQIIETVNTKDFLKGYNQFNLSTKNLKAGTYFYSIDNGKNKVSKAFNITR